MDNARSGMTRVAVMAGAAAIGALAYMGIQTMLRGSARGRRVSSSLDDEDYGSAPESGEPSEVYIGFARGAGVNSDDPFFAPESGDRVMEAAVVTSSESPQCPTSVNEVTEGSEESFPASDAPAWTAGRI